MTTTKQDILDRAITDIQNQIMYAWKSVMKYEEQMRNISVYEENEDILLSLIANEKSKIETLSAVLDVLQPSKPHPSEIQEAKETLRRAGYHTDSLWHVEDITLRYECDSDDAYEILTHVLDTSIEDVFSRIHNEAVQQRELKEKEL